MQIFSGKISFTYFAFIFINQPRCMVGTLSIQTHIFCATYAIRALERPREGGRGSECQKNYCEQKEIWLCVTLTNRPRTVRFLSLKYFISRPMHGAVKNGIKSIIIYWEMTHKKCVCVFEQKKKSSQWWRWWWLAESNFHLLPHCQQLKNSICNKHEQFEWIREHIYSIRTRICRSNLLHTVFHVHAAI